MPALTLLLTLNLAASALAQTADLSAGATATLGSVFTGTRALLLVGLLLVSAFLTASETAFNTLGEWRLRQLRSEESSRRRAFELLAKHPQRFSATLLVGKTMVNAAIAILVALMAFELAAAGALSVPLTIVYAVLITTALRLLFAEIVPRSIVARQAVGVAGAAVWPLYALSIVVYPIGVAFTYLTGAALRLLRIEHQANPQMSETELHQVLMSAEESGVLETQEQEMIMGVIDLEETVVREIMTPRVDVVGIPEESSLLQLLELVTEHGYSRLPVFSGTIDNIKGLVYARDLLPYLGRDSELRTATVADIMNSVQYIPETVSVMALLRDMRLRKSHLAVVVDEFGGTSGVITLEDIVEEITGEIYDETDEDDEREITELEDGRMRILGSVHLETVGDELDLEFDEDGDYDTIAGFMIDELGHIPESGETVEYDGVTFTVEQADGRRVISVIASALPPDEPDDAAETEAVAAAVESEVN
ncbi:MAG: HlyC/CorC family transporter [Trueperaceae bacterium]|nr:HlyC/CorC family transporter [Trueperaceae bacterium]